GRRVAVGCVRRSTDEAPPRQLGFAGRKRRGATDFTVRFSGMTTTSFGVLGPVPLGAASRVL
ncbi:MAG: hypothetical protein ABUL50_13300, partial [Rhizobacter sp.]